MSLFADRIKNLTQRIRLNPEEFSTLVSKHGLENYNGPKDVLFGHVLYQGDAVLLNTSSITTDNFQLFISNETVCLECDNSFFDELPMAA